MKIPQRLYYNMISDLLTHKRHPQLNISVIWLLQHQLRLHNNRNIFRNKLIKFGRNWMKWDVAIHFNTKSIFVWLIAGPSEENNIESIIDNNKSIGDSSTDGCDISSQTASAVNQPAQLSIATVSQPNVDGQQVSYHALDNQLEISIFANRTQCWTYSNSRTISFFAATSSVKKFKIKFSLHPNVLCLYRFFSIVSTAATASSE